MATKKTNNATKSKIPVSAKIDRMIERENATVKAYASVNIGGAFVIKDIAVVDGQKGMFARMPFRSYKTGSGETKYSDIAFALTDEARQSLNDAVLGAYREALEESEDELPDEDESQAQKYVTFSRNFSISLDFCEFFRYCVSRGDHDDETENARSPPCRTDDTRPCGM